MIHCVQITSGKKNFAVRLAGQSEIGCGSVGQSELGAAASRKAVSWNLRLASLLTHLFSLFSSPDVERRKCCQRISTVATLSH